MFDGLLCVVVLLVARGVHEHSHRVVNWQQHCTTQQSEQGVVPSNVSICNGIIVSVIDWLKTDCAGPYDCADCVDCDGL